MKLITIVTDSSSYLTQAEASAMGVVMVPMSYSLGRAVYQEDFVDRDTRFDRLLDSSPESLHTSQATLSSFTTAFEALRAKGSEILCLTISSRLSGTYGNALMAARDLGGRGIAVVDSLSTAGGLYFLIREAHRMIEQGLALSVINDRLLEMRGRVRMFFSVDDIGPLRRSGRLGGVKLSISTILNIRPMLKCQDGAIITVSVARGRHEQLRQLASAVPTDATEVIVEHYRADSRLDALVRELRDAGKSVEIHSVGPVLAIHLGKGCIGVAWVNHEQPRL